MFFSELNGEHVVLVSGGVYRQALLYQREGYLYGKWGSGYVRLAADGSTSAPKVRMVVMSLYTGVGKDKLNRLCLSRFVEDAEPIEPQKLIGRA